MTTMFGSLHCCSQVLIREPIDKSTKQFKLDSFNSQKLSNEHYLIFEDYFNIESKTKLLKQNSQFVILVGPSFNNREVDQNKKELYEYSIILKTLTENNIKSLIYQQDSNGLGKKIINNKIKIINNYNIK
jgi:N-glycosylase/DNA lyase